MPNLWPDLIEQPSETMSVEYKSAAPWSKIRHKIKRTSISFANSVDVGYLVIGLRLRNGEFERTGLTPKQKSSFANVESVQSQIADCASPPIRSLVEILDYDGRSFVVITVLGQQALPHISCQTEYPGRQGIAKGVVYVRTQKPSSEVCGPLLWERMMTRYGQQMATNFLGTMRVVGCGMQFGRIIDGGQDVEDMFRKERGD